VLPAAPAAPESRRQPFRFRPCRFSGQGQVDHRDPRVASGSTPRRPACGSKLSSRGSNRRLRGTADPDFQGRLPPAVIGPGLSRLRPRFRVPSSPPTPSLTLGPCQDRRPAGHATHPRSLETRRDFPMPPWARRRLQNKGVMDVECVSTRWLRATPGSSN